MKLLIESLQNEYDKLCQRINQTDTAHRFLTERRDDGSPHVEVDENGYHYVATERGSEICRRTTPEKDELLYWMLADVTFWVAVSYEVAHRIENQDFRRMVFAKQLELLSKVNLKWADKRRREIDETLQKHPFIDPL